MSHSRRVNYSVSVGVIVTALLILQSDSENEYAGILLLPGLAAELVLTTLIPFGDREAFSYTHQGWAANVVFYSVAAYAILLLFRAIHWFQSELKAEAKHFGTSAIQQALGADSIAHGVNSHLKCSLREHARR